MRPRRTIEFGIFRCGGVGSVSASSMSVRGTPFNFLELHTNIVFQVLSIYLYRVRYKMGFRELAEFFLPGSFEFTHETVRDWKARFALIFAQKV